MVGDDAGDEVAAGAVVEWQGCGGGVEGQVGVWCDRGVGGEDPGEGVFVEPGPVGEAVDVGVGGADGVGPPPCGDVVPGFAFGEPEVLSDRGQVRAVECGGGEGAGDGEGGQGAVRVRPATAEAGTIRAMVGSKGRSRQMVSAIAPSGLSAI